MQIFPVFSVMDNPDSDLFATGNERPGQGAPALFADLFGQAQARVNSRAAQVGTSSEHKTVQPSQKMEMQDKKSLMATMAGKSTPIGNVKMTREDVASLEKGLKKFGLSNKEIEELRKKVDSGITWGGFLHALSNKMDRPVLKIGQESLGLETTREVTSFFQKLGFTPQEAGKFIKDLERGALLPVWKAVATKLKSMPANSLTGISKSELEALAKAMRMPKDAKNTLSGLFDSLGRKELSLEQLKAATATIKQYVAQAQKEMKEKNTALKQLVVEAVRKAVDRQEVEDAADNRETKAASQLKALIEHEAAKARSGTHDSTEKAANGKSAATEGKTRDNRMEVAEKAIKQEGKEFGQVVTVAKESIIRTSVEQNPKDTTSMAERFGRTAGNQEGSGQNDSNQGWSWNRSNYGDAKENQSSMQKDNAMDTPLGLFMSKLNHVPNGDVAHSLSSMEEILASHRSETTAQAREVLSQDKIMRQVESGLLRNLGEGKHQLTLRLDPPNLGKMMVILQVRNKEVNAVIRTQNQDVSRVVAENMVQLRHMLEQQGLKVEKLEVQTQLPNDQSPSHWQGSSQHNMAWERDVLGRQRMTWRGLHSKGEEVAQEMQNQPEAEKISSNGLDIFA